MDHVQHTRPVQAGSLVPPPVDRRPSSHLLREFEQAIITPHDLTMTPSSVTFIPNDAKPLPPAPLRIAASRTQRRLSSANLGPREANRRHSIPGSVKSFNSQRQSKGELHCIILEPVAYSPPQPSADSVKMEGAQTSCSPLKTVQECSWIEFKSETQSPSSPKQVQIARKPSDGSKQISLSDMAALFAGGLRISFADTDPAIHGLADSMTYPQKAERVEACLEGDMGRYVRSESCSPRQRQYPQKERRAAKPASSRARRGKRGPTLDKALRVLGAHPSTVAGLASPAKQTKRSSRHGFQAPLSGHSVPPPRARVSPTFASQGSPALSQSERWADLYYDDLRAVSPYDRTCDHTPRFAPRSPSSDTVAVGVPAMPASQPYSQPRRRAARQRAAVESIGSVYSVTPAPGSSAKPACRNTMEHQYEQRPAIPRKSPKRSMPKTMQLQTQEYTCETKPEWLPKHSPEHSPKHSSEPKQTPEPKTLTASPASTSGSSFWLDCGNDYEQETKASKKRNDRGIRARLPSARCKTRKIAWPTLRSKLSITNFSSSAGKTSAASLVAPSPLISSPSPLIPSPPSLISSPSSLVSPVSPLIACCSPAVLSCSSCISSSSASPYMSSFSPCIPSSSPSPGPVASPLSSASISASPTAGDADVGKSSEQFGSSLWTGLGLGLVAYKSTGRSTGKDTGRGKDTGKDKDTGRANVKERTSPGAPNPGARRLRVGPICSAWSIPHHADTRTDAEPQTQAQAGSEPQSRVRGQAHLQAQANLQAQFLKQREKLCIRLGVHTPDRTA